MVLRNVNATVGRLVTDLKTMAEKAPGCKCWNCFERFGFTVIFMNCDGTLIMVADMAKDRANMTVNQLVSELGAYDPSTKVVLTEDYKWTNFDENDGHFFTYDERIGTCLYESCGDDVRIPTQEQTDACSNQEYIDLGLSVMWATRNLGATVPEEYGGYYAWGEALPMKKPCFLSRLFKVDKVSGDAATFNLSSGWHTPTLKEFQELIDCCDWVWGRLNGVEGYYIQSAMKGYEGNWIFLPPAGFMFESGNKFWPGSLGLYWSSDLDSTDNKYAHALFIEPCGSTDVGKTGQILRSVRSRGYTIRPVKSR